MSSIPRISSLAFLSSALRGSTRGWIAVYCCLALVLAGSGARWCASPAPRDYEECSHTAETTAPSKEARTSLISQCEVKFFGRRKIGGGGYTYYDFMQNRSFDIAGPNPTPEELRWMDEQYIAYLEDQRRSAIAEAFAEKKRQETQGDFKDNPARASVWP
jgi:hypothetical protein